MNTDLHPDVLEATRPAPRPKPRKTEQQEALEAEFALVRRSCPTLLALLDSHTEIRLAPPTMGRDFAPPDTLTTGELLAFRAGQRSIFHLLRGKPDAG